MSEVIDIENRVSQFISDVEQLEIEQKAHKKTKEKFEAAILEKTEQSKLNSEELDIVTNAIAILRQVSDEAVQQSYEFITSSINAALERIFDKSTRKIKLKEYTRGGMYPQLEIELYVENGKTRSLKDDSGHGIMQIISLLCILSLIVITGSRKILVIDEMLSGLSAKSRSIVDDILWSFTEIGFQFIISEHGYIPRNSKVYHLEATGGVSKVVNEYIQSDGVYLDGLIGAGYNGYKEAADAIENVQQSIDGGASVVQSEVQGEIKSGNIISI